MVASHSVLQGGSHSPQGGPQIRALLQGAVDGCLQDHALTASQREQLLAATERIAHQLQQAAQQSGAPGPLQTRTQVTPSYLLSSPVYRPLSPAPVDLEVEQLEQQVNAAAHRAATLRQTVNAKLTGIYADKLAQLRPSIEAVEGAEAAQSAGGAAGAAEGTTAGGSGCGGEEGGQENVGAARDAPLTYSPDPQLLRDKLSEAGTKLPALRARLEEASDRVQRVFSVLSTELNRPPPNTVERVVMLGKTPGRAAPNPAPGGSPPACKQALESGMVSTRRTLRKDVQPLPLSLPDEANQP